MANWPQTGGIATAIRGEPISTTPPETGQVLAYDGTQWTPTSDVDVSGMTQLTGDVTAGPGGGSQAATVARIQGVAVATTAPSNGQVLAYNGTQWAPAAASNGLNQLTGDVTAGPGTGSQAATVAALQGRAVATTAPTTGQYLGWSGSQWAPSTPPDTGITRLTGDVTAGPGNGSQAATVAALQGRAIATTAPTNGQALVWVSASSQWAPGSVTATGSASGDLSGTYPGPTVAALQGRTVASTAPTNGQALAWSGLAWAPTTITAAGSASGDLSGTYPSPTVAKIQGRTVASTAPTSGQALSWDGSQWAPAAVVQAGAFSTSGLTGGALSLPYFAANGSATTLQPPATKTNQVLGWDAAGNLAWVGAMASVALFAGSQYVTDTYIIERYDVAIECPNGIITLDGTGIDTATGIV